MCLLKIAKKVGPEKALANPTKNCRMKSCPGVLTIKYNKFKFIINNHNLTPKKTLFIDDKKENTNAAENLGFVTWNLQVGKEDVTQLFEKNLL
jgi:hypothetical protein